MLELFAGLIMTFFGLSFIMVAFGAWGSWTLFLAIGLGFVYMFFTQKPLDK